MSKQTVAVVTGANRGIGLAICEKILADHSPVHLYACTRSGTDLHLSTPSNSRITYPTLDITNPSQINSLISQIRSTSPGKIILINNAGLNTPGTSPAEAKSIVSVNYHGTRAMCLAFLPLLTSSSPEGGNRGSRIVNVSSVASLLKTYSPAIRARFRGPNLTPADIDQLSHDYATALSTSSVQSSGWNDEKGYCVSKSLVNALTAVLARENSGLVINCCCPGWVNTDMGRIVGSQPAKTGEEGARIPVKLGFRDLGGVSGEYWGNDGVADTGSGRVQEW